MIQTSEMQKKQYMQEENNQVAACGIKCNIDFIGIC
jgi:hypothetical protein